MGSVASGVIAFCSSKTFQKGEKAIHNHIAFLPPHAQLFSVIFNPWSIRRATRTGWKMAA